MYSKNTNTPVTTVFTMDLSQVAGTYDLCTAGGDMLLKVETVYVTTVGATWTSVSLQNSDTTVKTYLSAADGVVANFGSGANINPTFSGSAFLKRGKKLQYTITGATGSGAAQVYITFIPVVAYAALS